MTICRTLATYKGRPLLNPPAQIRTGGLPAYGSHLGCLTRKRSDGHGWRILGGGSHSRARLSILFHVVTSFWLRRRSERRQRSTTLKRNALSTRMLVGAAWELNQPWTTWPSHCPCRDGGSCLRFRRPSLISFSFARMRSPRLLRFKRKPPLRDLPQMKVKPRNLKVSGLLKPRRSRLAAAKRPNSIRRVLSGWSVNANAASLSRIASRKRRASVSDSKPKIASSA